MRCLPHGCYSLFIAILSVVSWGASLYWGNGCDYAIVTGPVVAELTVPGQRPPEWMEFGIGAYKAPNATECILIEESTDESFTSLMDNAWTTARTFAFLALAMGGGGTLFFGATTCFVFAKGTWRWTGYLLLFSSLCQSFTFLWFVNSLCDWNTCQIYNGTKADIVASVCWFLAGILILMYYPTPSFSRLQDNGEIPTATVLQQNEDELEEEKGSSPIRAQIV